MRAYGKVWTMLRNSGSAALVLVALPADAQLSLEATRPVERRWMVRMNLGSTSSGPASDLERAMIASDFDDTNNIFGIPGSPHPFSRTGIGMIGNPWLVAVHRRIGGRFSLALNTSNAPIGITLGYHSPGDFLFVNYSVFTVAPTVSVHIDAVHVGIGPAIYVAKTNEESGAPPYDSNTRTRAGALLDIGLSMPANTPFFFSASYQYRFVGNAVAGPFQSGYGDGPFQVMQATRVNYNHSFISLGLGFRPR